MPTHVAPSNSDQPTPYFQYAYLTYCSLTASIGFFFYGYYLGQLNIISRLLPCTQLPPGIAPGDAVQPFLGLNLPPCIPMSTINFSFANAILPLGGIPGAIISGQVTRQFGRLGAMRLLSIPFIMAPLALTFSNSYAWLLIGRFIAGMGVGGSATTVPIYLNEISPLHLRGTFGSLSATAIATGLAFAALMGFIFSTAIPGWRWIMALPFFVAVFQAFLLMFCVESPRWLGLHENEKNEAEQILVYRQLGHDPIMMTPSNVLADAASGRGISVPIAHSNAVMQPVSVREFLTQPEHRSSLIILALAFGSLQFCGVTVYFAYSTFILTLVLSQTTARLFYLIFIFAVVPVYYFSGMVVDRFGRRPVILGAMTGMSISAALLTISVVFSVPILTVLMFIGGVILFATGQANTPFILVSEVVEPRAVSVASSVAQMINLVCQFILLFVFPLLLNSAGPYTFLFFTGYLAITAFMLAMYLPETKGRSPLDVVEELREKRGVTNIGMNE